MVHKYTTRDVCMWCVSDTDSEFVTVHVSFWLTYSISSPDLTSCVRSMGHELYIVW